MIPNDDSYCELDPKVVDRWGIPVLRFHWKWWEHEILQVKHQHETFQAIIEKIGGRRSSPCRAADEDYGISQGRRDHPRGGHHPHGHEPPHVRAQRVVPGPRGEEPVRGRRRPVRHQRPQERAPGPSWPWPGAPPSTSPKSGRRGTYERDLDRRDVLKIMGAAPLAAASRCGRPRPPPPTSTRRARPRPRSRRARPTRRSSSPPTSGRPCGCFRHRDPEGRAVRRGHRRPGARVPGPVDDGSARHGPRARRTPDRLARGPGLARRRVRRPLRGQDVPGVLRAPSACRSSTTSPGRRRPGPR